MIGRTMKYWLTILSGIALAGAAPATGQPNAGQTPGTWIVNASEHFCSLTRTTQDPVPITFSLRIVPGETSAELLIVSPQWDRMPVRNLAEVELVLDPADARFTRTVRAGRLRNGDRIVALIGLPTGFVDGFSQARAIRLVHDGSTVIQFNFIQADRAMNALRDCVDYTLRDWRIDAAALESLRERPVMTEPWMTSDDYPVEALAAGFDGGVTAALSIDETGRITDCRILAASGRKPLDEAVCAAARRGGRYRPAINDKGENVAVEIVERIRFQIAY